MKTNEAKTRAAEILKRLRKKYPDAKCELDFTTPLQLAVAAILAAQCTDKRVNMVTPALFKKYTNAAAFATASQETLEQQIKSTGFFRNKAKSIRALAAALIEKHGGEIPTDLDTLVRLPGIGRKTANLIIADAFRRPGLIIDTHQIRVNQRLGLTKNSDATKIETDLQKIVPEENWISWSHCVTIHGRYTCLARKPSCAACPLTDLCPSVQLEN